MKNILFCILTGLLLCTFSSCKKERISLLISEQANPTQSGLRDVFFTDGNTGYVVGGDKFDQGELLTTTDGGITWTSDTLTDKRLNAMSFRQSDGKGFLVGFDSYFLQKAPTAGFWSFKNLPETPELHGIEFNDSNGVAVGGSGFRSGMIYHFSDDLGNTDTITSPLAHEMRDVAFLDEQTAIAVGYGIILRSTDGGRNWIPHPVDGDFFYSVCFPTAQVGYIVGVYGMILKTEDGGLNWKKLRKARTVAGNIQFRDVMFSSQDKGYIVGDRGLLWITEDGGDTWKVVENMPDIDLNAVWADGQKGYVVGKEGSIFQFSE